MTLPLLLLALVGIAWVILDEARRSSRVSVIRWLECHLGFPCCRICGGTEHTVCETTVWVSHDLCSHCGFALLSAEAVAAAMGWEVITHANMHEKLRELNRVA